LQYNSCQNNNNSQIIIIICKIIRVKLALDLTKIKTFEDKASVKSPLTTCLSQSATTRSLIRERCSVLRRSSYSFILNNSFCIHVNFILTFIPSLREGTLISNYFLIHSKSPTTMYYHCFSSLSKLLV